jgi:hypothetical protein
MHTSIPQRDGVRTTRWKYVRYISVEPVYEALFDLKNDPDEEQNLAGSPQYASRLVTLRAQCDSLRSQAR